MTIEAAIRAQIDISRFPPGPGLPSMPVVLGATHLNNVLRNYS
jgi:hypothetical protein